MQQQEGYSQEYQREKATFKPVRDNAFKQIYRFLIAIMYASCGRDADGNFPTYNPEWGYSHTSKPIRWHLWGIKGLY